MTFFIITIALINTALIMYVLYNVLKFSGFVFADKREDFADKREETYTTRDFTSFDERVERIQKELELYNKLPSDAPTFDSNVYNLPHDSVVLTDEDYNPPVEEETFASIVEISK